MSEVLFGGNMNAPILSNSCVFKDASDASPTIHLLMNHIRSQGCSFVPESIGVTNDKHQIAFVDGEVPHDLPEWIWGEETLVTIAQSIRKWHDATLSFAPENPVWIFESDEPHEVICHNDIAPYNAVFKNEKFVGLIDFDLCSPGTRLWDLAYAAYRFVPLLPDASVESSEHSPFTDQQMFQRLSLFLRSYADGSDEFLYSEQELLKKSVLRLVALSKWSLEYGSEHDNEEMVCDGKMYEFHAKWIESKCT